MTDWFQVALSRLSLQADDVTNQLRTAPATDWASWYYTPNERLVQVDYRYDQLTVRVVDGDQSTTCRLDLATGMIKVRLGGVLEGVSNGPPATSELAKVIVPRRRARLTAPTVVGCSTEQVSGVPQTPDRGPNLPLTILVEAESYQHTIYLEFVYHRDVHPDRLQLTHTYSRLSSNLTIYRLTDRGYCRLEVGDSTVVVLTPSGSTHRFEARNSPYNTYEVNQYGFLVSRTTGYDQEAADLFYVNWYTRFEIVPLERTQSYILSEQFLIQFGPITSQRITVRDITTGHQYSIDTRGLNVQRPLAFDPRHLVMLFSDVAGILLLPVNSQLPAYHVSPILTPTTVPVDSESLLDRYLDTMERFDEDIVEIRDLRQLGVTTKDLIRQLIAVEFPDSTASGQWITSRSMMVVQSNIGRICVIKAYQIVFVE